MFAQTVEQVVAIEKASARAGRSTIKLRADTYGHLSDQGEKDTADAMDQMPGAANG